MGQSEIIQALKNLGDRALRDDLIEEYFRIHYPDPIQRKEMMDKIQYKAGNALSMYLAKLRKNGIIDSILVPNPKKRYEVEYFLINP